MSEDQVNIGLQHRLIGAEDVDWDKDCKNEGTEFLTPFSVVKPLTKINAAHVPLDKDTYQSFSNGEKTVADALKSLKRTSGSTPSGSGSSSGMEEDTTVDISTSASTASAIQGIIDGNDIYHDLGGHVLTFKFEANGSWTLNTSLVFQNFYNGKLVIDLNGNALSLSAGSSVIKLVNCQCPVIVLSSALGDNSSIEKGELVFSSVSNACGILAEECSSVKCQYISFVNNTSSTTQYAFHGLSCDCHFESCAVTNNLFYKGGSKTNNVWNAGGKWIDREKLKAEVSTALDTLEQLGSTWEERLGSNYIVSKGTDATTGVKWIEYSDGLLIQYGSSSVKPIVVTTHAPGSFESSENYVFASEISLPKKYDGTSYLAFGQRDVDLPNFSSTSVQQTTWKGTTVDYVVANSTEIKITYGNLLERPGFVEMNTKKNNYFLFIISNAMTLYNLPFPDCSCVNVNWMTIGTINDSDKTPVIE